MKNITYLLGAGASAKSLPLVSDFSQRILKQIESIEKHEIPDNYPSANGNITSSEKYIEIFQKYKRDSIEIINKVENGTFDDYAKSLFNRGMNTDLKRLKAVISVFLFIEQAMCNVDNRYHTLLGNLITEPPINKLKPNYKILSWNYDYQIELSYRKYIIPTNVDRVETDLQIIPSIYKNHKPDRNKFSLIKLNGTAGLNFTEDKSINRAISYLAEPLLPITQKGKILGTILFALEHYYWYVNTSTQPLLRFAFEEKINSIGIVENAKTLTADTDILIIIGYSLPDYNQEIDLEIINNMNNLTRVIIQDYKDTAENLKSRFKNFYKNVEIIVDTNTNKFLYINNITS